MTAPEYELPAAMVEAAAGALFGWIYEADWPDDSTKERAMDAARDILAAALAGCEVEERFEAFWPEQDGEDGGVTSSWVSTEQTARLRVARSTRSSGAVRRWLHVTTSPEEVPDGQS